MKKIICVIVLLTLFTTFIYSQTKTDLVAYLLTGFVGFGSGHWYIGAENFKTHLIVDVATITGGAILLGIALAVEPDLPSVYEVMDDEWSSATFLSRSYAADIMSMAAYLSFAVYSGWRIYEVIDIFAKVEEARTRGLFGPIAKINGDRIFLGFSVGLH
jgi:hypothetical protein